MSRDHRPASAGTPRLLVLAALLAPGLLMAVPCAVGADGPVCTKRRPVLPLPLQIHDQRVDEVAHLDLALDGEEDLVFLSLDAARAPDGAPRYAVDRVVTGAGATLRTERLAEGAPLPFSVQQSRTLAGDFDGDGDADLAVVLSTSRGGGSYRADLFLGQGDGTFAAAPSLEAPFPVRDAALGDFDGDGQDELALLTASNVFHHRFEAGAGWSLAAEHALDGSRSAAAADFDGDGDDDLAVLIFSPTQLVRLQGDASQPLLERRVLRIPFRVYGRLRAFEADGAGVPELALGEWLPYPSWTIRLYALRHDPATGRLVDIWNVELPRRVRDWRPADVDGDGMDDFVIGYRFSTPYVSPNSSSLSWPPADVSGYQLLLGRGDAPPVLGERGQGSPWLVDLRDVDGDGRDDAVLLASPRRFGAVWYPGRSGPSFEEPDRYRPSPVPTAEELLPGDIDGDGDTDLLAYSRFSPAFSRSLLSRGDGTFAPVEGPGMLNWIARVLLRDADGDGLPDILLLPRDDPPSYPPGLATHLASGRGDGTFAPFRRMRHPSIEWPFLDLLFGDLDGDGDEDVLGVVPPWGGDDVVGWPLLVEEGGWRLGEHLLARPEFFSGLKLLDVDDDGIADPVYARRERHDGGRAWLVWRETRPGRPFGPERTILEWDGSAASFAQVFDEDLDGDGRDELLVQLARGPDRRTITRQSDGRGGYRTLWEGVLRPGTADGLVDLDGDGRVDLVDTGSGLRYWRGDGSGRFAEGAGAAWHGEPEAVLADFAGDSAPDLIAHFQLSFDRLLATSVNEPSYLPADVGPPSVELWLRPLVDERGDVRAYDDTWRVVTVVEDACDASPDTPVRRVDFQPLPDGTGVAFREGASEEIRVYEDPATGAAEVVLTGADEAASRARFERVRDAGGGGIDRVHVLQMIATGEYGPSPDALGDAGLVPDAHRLVRRWTFEGDRLARAASSRPGGDVTLTVVGEDHLGQRATARASFVETLRDYCEGPRADALVCGD